MRYFILLLIVIICCGCLDDAESDESQDEIEAAVERIWIDEETGLIWQCAANYPFTWKEAKTYCGELKWANYVGWRLPSISELRSLVSRCSNTEKSGSCGVTDKCQSINCWNEACEGCWPVIGDTYLIEEIEKIIKPYWYYYDIEQYWSSSEVKENMDLKWVIHYYYAEIVSENLNWENNVICVREIK